MEQTEIARINQEAKQKIMGMLLADATKLAAALNIDLYNRGRSTVNVEKRQVIMWKLCMKHYSMTDIGKALGYSHVTVGHSMRKVDDLLSINDRSITKLVETVNGI